MLFVAHVPYMWSAEGGHEYQQLMAITQKKKDSDEARQMLHFYVNKTSFET